MDVTRARELRAHGTAPQQLGRLLGRGELVRVRHGAYTREAGVDAASRHRQLIAGTWPLLSGSLVISHASAALLHELPVWDGMLARVTLTRAGGGHGRVGSHLRVRVAPLGPAEITQREGFRVTSLARSAVDLARDLDYDRAVAVLDAALHRGADPVLLASTVAGARCRRGVGTARAALEFADRRAESVGESLSRVRIAQAGLEAPELQVDIYDELGNWVARSDFGWVRRGVLGEFDGKVKYIGTPEVVAKAVLQEKRREANLRDLGWVVVRWGFADLRDRQALRRRIEGGFSQARPAAIAGHARAARA